MLFELNLVTSGAGYQKESMREEYFSLCESACDAGILEFKSGKSSVDAVKCAIQIMEDCEFTNAGFGSNLTMDGTVECDASIMCGSNLRWTGVASASGLKNPICVAKRLYDAQDEKRECGLVTPVILAGDGLKTWAELNGFGSTHDLISKRSLVMYEVYKKRVEDANQLRIESVVKKQKSEEPLDTRLDTVGAVAISRDGITASGVSSGGVALKISGRVGQAASFGSGCYSLENCCISTSGVGEYLIKTSLGLRMCEKMVHASQDGSLLTQVVKESFLKDFIDSQHLKEYKVDDRIAGVLTAARDSRGHIELLCAHNTPSMLFSFKSTKSKKAQNHVSRFDKSVGRLMVNAFMIRG